LGEIPVRKPGAPRVLRPDGTQEEDTSFLARIPADTAVTFQTLDRRGLVLNMAQTWHQVRPGEARYDGGGAARLRRPGPRPPDPTVEPRPRQPARPADRGLPPGERRVVPRRGADP